MRGGAVGGGGGGGVVVDCHCEWVRGRAGFVKCLEGFVNRAESKRRDCCYGKAHPKDLAIESTISDTFADFCLRQSTQILLPSPFPIGQITN